MSLGINRVTLLGHVGRDPEVRRMADGATVAQLTLATTERWRDRSSGESQEHTEWHRLVCWRRQAEIAEQYVRKGSRLHVDGRLRTRKWQDQGGQDRYTTEVIVDRLLLLDSPNPQRAGPGTRPEDRHAASQAAQTPPADLDDDIPF